MFCPNCGNNIPNESLFCPHCGTDLSKQHSNTLIGFSNMYYDPRIQEKIKASKKSSKGCFWIFFPMPFVFFLLAGLFIEEMPIVDALVIGGGLSLILLIIGLVSLSKDKRPIWEGYVVDKNIRHRRKEQNDSYVTKHIFTVVIKSDAGKKADIVGINERALFDYYNVGDRVRFYPVLDTYEKYDKSKDKVIFCNVCKTRNPISKDICKSCKYPLFK